MVLLCLNQFIVFKDDALIIDILYEPQVVEHIRQIVRNRSEGKNENTTMKIPDREEMKQ